MQRKALEQPRNQTDKTYVRVRGSARIKTWEFWRNLAVHFSLCSVVGHWLEVPWCIFCAYVFNIYDPNSLVWGFPLYPFMVYGFGALVCIFLLTPLAENIKKKRKHKATAALEFYLICVFACMAMEVGMGLLLNQPVDGVYPLWDNAKLPFNVLNQAWIPNDLLLGACALIYTWIAYPLVEDAMFKVEGPVMNIIAVVVVVGFILLSIVSYSGIVA
jgi:uncharacterized membrane protein